MWDKISENRKNWRTIETWFTMASWWRHINCPVCTIVRMCKYADGRTVQPQKRLNRLGEPAALKQIPLPWDRAPLSSLTMIQGYGPVTQALLGTLFTWGVTAAGAGLVFVFSSGKRRILDGSLGFAAGVMLAASYWSLLAPAIELAQLSGNYGTDGQWAFIPAAVGFLMGAVFVYGADVVMPALGSPSTALALQSQPKIHEETDPPLTSVLSSSKDEEAAITDSRVTQRRRKISGTSPNGDLEPQGHDLKGQGSNSEQRLLTWKRILLLIVAITIHNIPEGLAVGVGFGAVGKTPSATFESARNLAIGIGIQNFPEGLAVSLPLRGSGYSTWMSFWYGQLSGMVEPLAAVVGAVAVVIAEPILPFALSFAAGAMVYVVADDILPEAQTSGNGLLASWGTIVGFIIMMSLDVGLG
ncbi:zinc transporter ZIP11-like isoform X2 [Acanthaster planci]|uniref:Zinc transporter ZIP11 n=1 Tax=Acanthaster planci TaxID=133434 RepID=A0A8B7YGN6_ACAPL|nr:zinc transporter ZIP11-like isoform X2 [Acanthaster planci]